MQKDDVSNAVMALREACQPITAQIVQDEAENSHETFMTSNDMDSTEPSAPAQPEQQVLGVLDNEQSADLKQEVDVNVTTSLKPDVEVLETRMIDVATQTDDVSAEELAEMTMRQQLEVFACDVIGEDQP